MIVFHKSYAKIGFRALPNVYDQAFLVKTRKEL